MYTKTVQNKNVRIFVVTHIFTALPPRAALRAAHALQRLYDVKAVVFVRHPPEIALARNIPPASGDKTPLQGATPAKRDFSR